MPRFVKFGPLNEWALQNIFYNQVFLNTPGNLNDSMEFSFDLDLSEEMFKKSHSELVNGVKRYFDEIRDDVEAIEFFKNRAGLHIDANDGFKFDNYDEFFKTIYYIVKWETLKYKVTSFSARSAYRNPLMWGHYAEKMSGICVEYEFDYKTMPLGKVRYSTSNNNTPKIKVPRVLSPKQRNGALKKVFHTKKHDWNYEKEYRLLLGESLCKLPEESLKCISFGYKCDPVKAQFLVDLVRDKFNDVSFDIAVPSLAEYQILTYAIREGDLGNVGKVFVEINEEVGGSELYRVSLELRDGR